MDYYIIVNGQKEGPVDILSFIKKVKNGSITASTQVSVTEEGPFRPAGEIEDLKSIIKSQTGYRSANGDEQTVNININTLFNEGTDAWLRKIVEYTIFFGVIMVAGAAIPSGLRKIAFFADYGYITNYITSVITYTLLGLFSYYVLMTKRSQDPHLRELLSVVKFSLPHILLLAALLSLLTLPLGLNPAVSGIMLIVIIAALGFTAFVPFLVTDHRMSFKRALMVSLESFKTMQKKTMIVVFGVIVVNIAAGLIPVLIHSQIVLLGLVVIVPISISILAQIYDRLLA